MDYASYIDNPEKTVFFAYIDEQLTGQIILRKNWNGFAYVEDIAVDSRFRRQGIGRRLMNRAGVWAKVIQATRAVGHPAWEYIAAYMHGQNRPDWLPEGSNLWTKST